MLFRFLQKLEANVDQLELKFFQIKCQLAKLLYVIIFLMYDYWLASTKQSAN